MTPTKRNTVRRAERNRARAPKRAPDGLPACTCRRTSYWDRDCPRCWLTPAERAVMLDQGGR